MPSPLQTIIFLAFTIASVGSFSGAPIRSFCRHRSATVNRLRTAPILQSPTTQTPTEEENPSYSLQSLPLPMANQQLPMVEVCANGQVIRYRSTLTSIRSIYGANKLTSRDVRLLRSSAPVLAPRQGYILFDLGELRGILQHDRLILIGADLPAVGALGAEIQRRLEVEEMNEAGEQTPFEVRALECMLEQVYAVLDDTLGTLSGLVQSTLRDLTNPQSVDPEGRREAALSRLLPLRISLSRLQARTRRVSVLLDEILDSEEDVADMCLTHLARLDPANPQLEMDPPEGMDSSSEQHSSSSSSSNGVEAPGSLSSSENDAAKTEVVTSDGLTDKVLQGGDMMNLEASLDAEVAAAEAEAEAAEAAQELVETLLDVYDARLNSLVDRIEQLASTIENTQDVLELTLDNERNRIARLELLLSMAGLSIGTCSAVSGFFGMNLLSGVRMHTHTQQAAQQHTITTTSLTTHPLASHRRRVHRRPFRLCHRDIDPPYRLPFHHLLAPIPNHLAPTARPLDGRRRPQERPRAARPRRLALAQPRDAASFGREGDAGGGEEPLDTERDTNEQQGALRPLQPTQGADGR